ncbi:AAEL005667-PA, partial [Aedes aegypti]
VNGGSVADQAGLMPGDALVKVNNTDVFNLRHKEAQDVIMAAGNSFELSVSRGTAWRPSVTPTGSIPSPSPSMPGHITPVTKTSLAATPQPAQHIGSGHNQAAKPFPSVNGSEGPIKSIVNKQYNTPVAMYSDETIAETLSSQAEVLAGGVLGVNFKKNERVYSPANSEVYKLLHEQGDEPEPGNEDLSPVPPQMLHHPHPQPQTQPQQHHPQQQQQAPHHPLPRPPMMAPPAPAPAQVPAPAPAPLAIHREDFGVFVRIKDKNLHADCFKCATCGSSLKNQGYFNLNDKLYCDIHARLAALQSPPPGTNGMVPVTITKPTQSPSHSRSSSTTSSSGYCNSSSLSPVQSNKVSPLHSRTSSENELILDPSTTATKLYDYEEEEEEEEEQVQKPAESPAPLFTWPPKRPDDEIIPLATPIYIPVPETQKVVVKPVAPPPERPREKSKSKSPPEAQKQQQQQQQQQQPPPQEEEGEKQFIKSVQSKSAPELSRRRSDVQQPQQCQEEESYETYTTTTTSTSASSEEYQMYSTQTSQPIVTLYDTPVMEMDYPFSSGQRSAQKFGTEIPSQMENMPVPSGRLSMTEALATAPERPYTPFTEVQLERSEMYEKLLREQPSIQVDPEKNYSAFASVGGNRTPVPFKPIIPEIREPEEQPAPEPEPEPEPEPVIEEKKPEPEKPKKKLPPYPRKDAGSDHYSLAPRRESKSPLHQPAEIPNYQRKWYNLPTQNPPHTPEPEELRQNVPLAFVDTHSKSHLAKPIAQTVNTVNIRDQTVSYRETPVTIQTQQRGEMTVQTRSQESALREQASSERTMHSASQVGNALIQKRTRILASINSNSDYRKQASNVLKEMLEARLKKHESTTLDVRSKNKENLLNNGETLPKRILNPSHPMSRIIDMCDSSVPTPPPLPKSQIPFIMPQEQKNIQPPSTNLTVNSVVLRPKNNNHINGNHTEDSPGSQINHRKVSSELTSHARDRRSYVEKNNNFNGKVLSSLVDKVPICNKCNHKIVTGPFITALGRIWCPDHFICHNGNCKRPLADIGFVEEKGDLYCEYCFEEFLAPVCSKCNTRVKGDCLNAIGKQFHPECFKCAYCGKLFGNSPFFLEEGDPYCEADWNELFTTKCFACGFPVEAGDKWVEALNNNYHSQCFNCTSCKKNLEGQSFFAKGGRPFCKNHAR